MATKTQVYIGRLPYNVEESDVDKFFRGYGKIESISLKNGYGFVIFTDQKDAKDAVQDLNRQKLNGERVIVDFARGSRDGGGGGGGGGWRGGGGGGGRGGGGRDFERNGGGYRDGGRGGRSRSRSPVRRPRSLSRTPSPRRSPSPRRPSKEKK